MAPWAGHNVVEAQLASPDFINQRWADQLHTAMDVAPSTSVVPAYDDGTEDTFLVAGDGNSRVVSMWLARTGGDIEVGVPVDPLHALRVLRPQRPGPRVCSSRA